MHAKYKKLEIEIVRMFYLNISSCPTVIGALGMVKKNTDTLIKKMPGNPPLFEI